MTAFRIIKPDTTVGEYEALVDIGPVPEFLLELAGATIRAMNIDTVKAVFTADQVWCARLERESSGAIAYLGTVTYFREIQS